MKFLVLAVIVASASAATFGRTPVSPSRISPARASPAVVVAAAPPAPILVAEKVYNVAEKDVAIPIVRATSDVTATGFNWAFEGANGIAAQEEGQLKKIEDKEAVVVKGSYQYVSPDGTPVNVVYVADENGFQPQGDVLPVAPAVPEAIARSLRYIADHPELVAKFNPKVQA